MNERNVTTGIINLTFLKSRNDLKIHMVAFPTHKHAKQRQSYYRIANFTENINDFIIATSPLKISISFFDDQRAKT